MDRLNIPNQEEIDALITERLLLFHDRLVEDYGLEQVRPKSNRVAPVPSRDED